VTHAEYSYLWGLVELTRLASEKARKEGEVFHPSLPYSQLHSGLKAIAWFAADRVTLRLRHPIHEEQRWASPVALAFHAFFPTGCVRADPVTKGGWTTHEGSTACSQPSTSS
jgi:hypothetical protein